MQNLPHFSQQAKASAHTGLALPSRASPGHLSPQLVAPPRAEASTPLSPVKRLFPIVCHHVSAINAINTSTMASNIMSQKPHGFVLYAGVGKGGMGISIISGDFFSAIKLAKPLKPALKILSLTE